MLRLTIAAALLLAPLGLRAQPVDIRHELGKIVSIDPETNQLDFNIFVPPNGNRLSTTYPGFYIRAECKGANWNPDPMRPDAQVVAIPIQWAVYGPNGQLDGPSAPPDTTPGRERGVAFGRCPQQDRDVIVDITSVMPRNFPPLSRIAVWAWPPVADPQTGEPKVLEWLTPGMHYEVELPEGPRGPQGVPGINGQPGRDGAPGLCEQQCSEPPKDWKHGKLFRDRTERP